MNDNLPPNEKQNLPVHWVEEEGFNLAPFIRPPAGTRSFVNPPALVQGDLSLPPLQTS